MQRSLREGGGRSDAPRTSNSRAWNEYVDRVGRISSDFERVESDVSGVMSDAEKERNRLRQEIESIAAQLGPLYAEWQRLITVKERGGYVAEKDVCAILAQYEPLQEKYEQKKAELERLAAPIAYVTEGDIEQVNREHPLFRYPETLVDVIQNRLRQLALRELQVRLTRDVQFIRAARVADPSAIHADSEMHIFETRATDLLDRVTTEITTVSRAYAPMEFQNAMSMTEQELKRLLRDSGDEVHAVADAELASAAEHKKRLERWGSLMHEEGGGMPEVVKPQIVPHEVLVETFRLMPHEIRDACVRYALDAAGTFVSDEGVETRKTAAPGLYERSRTYGLSRRLDDFFVDMQTKVPTHVPVLTATRPPYIEPKERKPQLGERLRALIQGKRTRAHGEKSERDDTQQKEKQQQQKKEIVPGDYPEGYVPYQLWDIARVAYDVYQKAVAERTRLEQSRSRLVPSRMHPVPDLTTIITDMYSRDVLGIIPEKR